jgi:peroxiredoxin
MSEASEALQRENNRLITELRRKSYRNESITPVVEEMAGLDKKKLALLDSLKKTQPFLADILALRTYLSYHNHGQQYGNEILYFAENYFQYAALEKDSYERIPQVHDAFKRYASTLASVNLPLEALQQYIDRQLERSGPGSRSHKAALSGVISGFAGRNENAFAHYAERYLDRYPALNPGFNAQLEQQLKAVKSRIVGAVAPEISLPNPEGESLNLTDLRGKVVLIDFWAGWCGPCRRENPNLRRIYDKFKDKGFEIYAVSLDRDRATWLKAIEQDSLPWLHVSDLKYFQSEAALTYGVNAIPHSVLLDREGRIVATKLRGRQLEARIDQLFMEE